jgi:hypothetical protein
LFGNRWLPHAVRPSGMSKAATACPPERQFRRPAKNTTKGIGVIKLLGLVSTPAAADWDASVTVERINL